MQRAAQPIDAQVGARVRMCRRTLGMTQTDLGIALGVTFQQVQKYEKGTNRIGAGRLHDIANALHVPVSAFFEDHAPSEGHSHGLRIAPVISEAIDLTSSDEGLALARSFVRIGNAQVRRRVVRLVEELSKAAHNSDAAESALGEAAPIRAEMPDSDRA
jgi:transcriptional regulator with XRE-family HTH domain